MAHTRWLLTVVMVFPVVSLTSGRSAEMEQAAVARGGEQLELRVSSGAHEQVGSASATDQSKQSGSGPTAGLEDSAVSSAAEEVGEWPHPRTEERFQERRQMIQQIRQYGLQDEEVLAAMAGVPRHEFVPSRHQERAYADSPLPIGYGQTISQPYIVAEMTRRLQLTETSKVLEVGTGSGYQAAVLTEFTPHVCTIEIIEPLADHAASRLERLGYTTVDLKHGDGYYGWPEKAPFDAIVVTAHAGEIPPPLVRQLKPGGRMVIPVGGALGVQWLTLVTKDKEGEMQAERLSPVRFVPLRRKDITAE